MLGRVGLTCLFGHVGLNIVDLEPRQPFELWWNAGPATPESPDAQIRETPWRPSFMNLEKLSELLIVNQDLGTYSSHCLFW